MHTTLSNFRQWRIETEEDLHKIKKGDLLYQKSSIENRIFQINIEDNKIGFKLIASLDKQTKDYIPLFYKLTLNTEILHHMYWITHKHNYILSPINKTDSILNKIKYLDQKYESRNRERKMS